MRQKWCHSETEAGPGMAPGGKREVQKKSCKKCWKIGIGDEGLYCYIMDLKRKICLFVLVVLKCSHSPECWLPVAGHP